MSLEVELADDIRAIKDWYLAQHESQQLFVARWVVERIPFFSLPDREISPFDFLKLFNGMLTAPETNSAGHHKSVSFLGIVKQVIDVLILNYPKSEDDFLDCYNIMNKAKRIEEVQKHALSSFKTDDLNAALLEHMKTMLFARSSWEAAVRSMAHF